MSKWIRGNKLSHVAIGACIFVDWNDYDFSINCDEGSIFPKGIKEGKHKFTIGFSLFMWGVRLIFYKPKED
jgi:hypothetical protein